MESAPAAIVVEDSAARREVADALRAIQRADTLSPTIKEVRTLEGFVPEDQGQKMALIRRLRRVVEGHEEAILEGQSDIDVEGLKRWLNVNEITASDLPDFIVRKFRGPDGTLGEFVVIGTSVSLRDGKQTIAFAEDIREIDTPHFGKFYASGSAVIFADMLLVMQKDSVIAITVTLLVVFAVVLLQFGTKRAALLAILPVLVDGVLVAFSKITGAGFHAKFEELAWAFGAEAVRRLLATGRQVDALFVANDPIAVGAIRALQEAGRRIPQDVRVCSFDEPDVPLGERVPLIMVKQPRLALGRKAAEALIERIEERRAGKPRQPPRVIRLEAEVVVPEADSTAPAVPSLTGAVSA